MDAPFVTQPWCHHLLTMDLFTCGTFQTGVFGTQLVFYNSPSLSEHVAVSIYKHTCATIAEVDDVKHISHIFSLSMCCRAHTLQTVLELVLFKSRYIRQTLFSNIHSPLPASGFCPAITLPVLYNTL